MRTKVFDNRTLFTINFDSYSGEFPDNFDSRPEGFRQDIVGAHHQAEEERKEAHDDAIKAKYRGFNFSKINNKE